MNKRKLLLKFISVGIMAFVIYMFHKDPKLFSYASRIIQVEKNQKVISTGPYAYIRHPMYLGVLIMYFFMPIALGSFYALLAFIFLPVHIVQRIRNEEKVLEKELPGYEEYKEKVKFKLIPKIW